MNLETVNGIVSELKYNSISFIENVQMCDFTTFKIGGIVPLLVKPSSSQDVSVTVRILKKYRCEYLTVGRGSNLLVSDDGIDKVVIYTGNMNHISVSGNKISAQSGTLLSKVANEAMKNSLCGMEGLHGIPGSVGGAVVMNAGAYGSEMSQVVSFTEYVDKDGNFCLLKDSEHEFGYRTSALTDTDIVTNVGFCLKHGNYEEIKTLMHDLSEKRRASQPLEFPSAGSVFKRPTGFYAGKLIQDCGLKGCQVGGACVSEKHAGFIVNTGGAKASDVLSLIRIIQQTVEERYGVVLEPEIKIV